MKITLKHGSGGEESGRLIKDIFTSVFDDEILLKMEDSAVLPPLHGNPVLTSDSFVVEPLFFKGGDIGKLSVCGTVNDLSSMGARPLYLTVSFILETGLDADILGKIVQSMKETTEEAGVRIVAGDTKVIEGEGGLYINTAGVGERPSSRDISCRNMKSGDTLILTGTLGDHHAAVLTNRLGIESEIESDCAPLNHMVEELLEGNISVHTVRDITRGGLATVANELAVSSSVRIELEEGMIPVSDIVRGITGILGLDPLTMGNEGKMIIAVPPRDAEKAVGILRRNKYGRNAVAAGQVLEGKGVYLRTALGGLRRVLPLRGEGLPRIC